MSEATARAAFAAATGRRAASASMLAAGRTSTAWLLNDGTQDWIVRVPLPDSGRTISYRSEQLLTGLMPDQPVAQWSVVDVDGLTCSVSRRIVGTPVDYDDVWSQAFARRFASLLAELHAVEFAGFGPLRNDAATIVGTESDSHAGILARWSPASIWPFDGSTLESHPVAQVAPAIADFAAGRRDDILAAAGEPFGVLHSDLHREHLLMTPDGGLAGVLDFGDACVLSLAWDFALLHWYYVPRNVEMVADAYGVRGTELSERGKSLSIAVGLYKLAKSPRDHAVLQRLHSAHSGR